MSSHLQVSEIFHSIQGESTFAGLPCTFIRLSGCNLNCTYCDTGYAHSQDSGATMSIEMIMEKVCSYPGTLVEVTGGEPLLQSATPELTTRLLKQNFTVLIETNGSVPVSGLPDGCHRIIDVKCPSSGASGTFLLETVALLTARDELKFVIGSHDDFVWAENFIQEHQLQERVPLLFSPVAGRTEPAALAEWILNSGMQVRMQVQLHKIIWGDKQGV